MNSLLDHSFQYGKETGNFGIFKFNVEFSYKPPDWVYIWNLIQESGNQNLIKWAVCKVSTENTMKDTIRMRNEDLFGRGSGI